MLDSMKADRVRLLDLEARIMDLERSISAMRVEQDLVQERLDAYKYPVLTLPNEITSQIFLHFLPIYPYAPPLGGLDSPTSLTYVCRHWRDVALATPALWRAIRLVDYFTNMMPYEQRRHISDAWISRSGSCPLSIEMEIGILRRAAFTEPKPKPMALATARWEHLRLCGDGYFLPELGPMPMLRSLELDMVACGINLFVFHEVPQLRTVVLTRSVSSKVILRWIQLTCLTLNYVEIDPCVQILEQTLNLVQFVVLLDDIRLQLGLTELDLSDLALPRLESLALRTCYGPSQQTPVPGFLHSFITPSLRRLELEEVFLGAQPIPALELFIAKSGCRLQDVCIRFSRGTATDHESYRLVFPSIPTFSFPLLARHTEGKDRLDSSDSSSDESEYY
ncbi:hypothetical protein B0H12DRAFT_1331741 [Mycena haematopus]|nr:hypothetical protein B0H12DRAFT_1331741 [Mycena haematopus]